ncbi:MAG: ROK family protein, partial [Albidovulum sp.]|nr:ROK family protein [Albidovulum sp.]
VVRFANDAVGQLLYQLSPEEQLRVAGLGIAMPFRLWQWARPLGVRQSDMDAWRGRDIRSELSELLDWPVYLQNDASAACSAELVFGSSEKPSNFLYFFIGFFVGGGLVIGNKVFTGATGNAAALGSLPVVVKNNKIQQLIDLASLATLENAISNSGGDGNSIWKSTSFWNIPGNTLNDWLDQAASGLAAASVTAACVLDFECAFVDGWLSSEVKTRLVEFANQKIKTMALAGIDTPQIREGAIGSEARSLGAASLPLSDRFLVDRDSRLNGS